MSINRIVKTTITNMSSFDDASPSHNSKEEHIENFITGDGDDYFIDFAFVNSRVLNIGTTDFIDETADRYNICFTLNEDICRILEHVIREYRFQSNTN